MIDDNDILLLARQEGHKFRYKFVPIVAYNKKTSGNDDLTKPFLGSFNSKALFSLYQLGTSITTLIRFMGNKNLQKEDFYSARKAFRELKNFAAQCNERTIADLCCKVILGEIEDRKEDEEIVFFLEKSASDKMLGRLATLNLNLDKITICFLITNPSDLMTTVMSYQTGKLHFDINRLSITNNDRFQGPYPGDYEDSLVQSFFYHPFPTENGAGAFIPMRLDIFAQGLLVKDIESKKERISGLLNPRSPDIETGSSTLEPRTLLPYGFNELEGFLEREKSEVEQIIMRVED
jgi:hypothetical protein